jgi:tetratricopeptide (TPR) repeat protein
MSSSPAVGTSARTRAAEAHALVQSDPRRALLLAERALTAASVEGDAEAQVSALHALGWSQHVLGDGTRAVRTMRSGIRLAERTGDERGAALLRRLLASSLALAGKTRAARREIDAALVSLSGLEKARSQVHRVGIHTHGHTVDPEVHRRILADAASALRLLRRHGDEVWEARLLYNRGLLHFERGELERAESDLRRARALYTHVGADAAAVNVVVALAQLALLRGEVVTTLNTLAEVDASLTAEHRSYAVNNLAECRMRALVQARLLPEARAAADAYAELEARNGRRDYASMIMLDQAAIELMSQDPTAARHLATTAMRSFAARGRPVNAAVARTLALRAQLLSGRVTRASVRAGLEAAAVLDTAGWQRDAMRARLLVARVAVAAGSLAVADEQLALARRLQTRGTVTDRIELRHVRALLLLTNGDRTGAERELERGLRLLDEYRAALGATELRVGASGIGSELAERGLGIAIEALRPEKMLAWAERLRANALRLPPVRPPADKRLRELQIELRRATTEGRTGDQTRLESAIRSRARIVDAAGGVTASIADARAAARLLGERALVEYVELDGGLHALMLTNGRLALHDLGSASAVAELEWLRFAYGRLAAGRMTAQQRAASQANADTAAMRLDELLIEPLLPAIGDAPLVLVPTGALHALPWSALSSLRGRPIEVAPSLTVWCELAARPRTRRRKTVLAGGPRLRYAAREAHELGALRPGATVLHGREATAEATLKALDGAALAHLACHGHFRADSPLFSSLELADGRLNVYELQQLTHAPELVVLSACDLALSALHPGDELLGFAAALLGMGTRTIVASVVPVPDAAARRLMLALHRELLAGAAPATALARAQKGAKTPGFICLGAG